VSPLRSISQICDVGTSTVLLALDARTERYKYRICNEMTYDLIFDKLDQAVQVGVTKHLVILVGVPIIYPHLRAGESTLKRLNKIKHLDGLPVVGGLSKGLLNKVGGGTSQWNGDAGLLDDLHDHWNATGHQEERKVFIERLQKFAHDHSCRVSFLSGDVHMAAAGVLSTKNVSKYNDPAYMTQIVSSAIVNTPPPNTVLKLIHYGLQKKNASKFSDQVEQQMLPIFTSDTDGTNRNAKKDEHRFMLRRNWTSIRERAQTEEDPGALEFTIWAEKEPKGSGSVGYQVDTPTLSVNIHEKY